MAYNHASELAKQNSELQMRKIYSFILDCMKAKGQSPTLKQVGEQFGFTKQRAQQILAEMEKKGYVIKTKKAYGKIIPEVFF